MIFRSLGSLAFALGLAQPVTAASLTRITTDGGLGNIAFQHLAMNATGDFVGVSNSRVFAGNVQERRVEQVLAQENTSFVLTASTSFQVEGQTGQTTINIDVDVLASRLAINAQGDFVVASNTRLFVGNARTGQVGQVVAAPAFTEFQTVKINDAGQYVAIGAEKIYGGKVADANATLLLDDAVGTFEIAELYGFQLRVDGSASDQRLALNASGKFVAATRSAVYVGDLAALTVSKILEQRAIGFKHVALNDQGDVTVVSEQDVFVGTAN